MLDSAASWNWYESTGIIRATRRASKDGIIISVLLGFCGLPRGSSFFRGCSCRLITREFSDKLVAVPVSGTYMNKSSALQSRFVHPRLVAPLNSENELVGMIRVVSQR